MQLSKQPMFRQCPEVNCSPGLSSPSAFDEAPLEAETKTEAEAETRHLLQEARGMQTQESDASGLSRTMDDMLDLEDPLDATLEEEE